MILTLRYSSLIILYIFHIIGCWTQSTCGGNGNNANCTFPFIYHNVTFNQCTYHPISRRWCSITSNYDNDRKWGYCDCPYDTLSLCTPSPTGQISNDHPHFTYTQGTLNNGVLETTIIKLRFADRSDQGEITISDQIYQNTIDSVAMYYTDSSFGKLTYNFRIIEKNYISNLSSAIVSTDEVQICIQLGVYFPCYCLCMTPMCKVDQDE